LQVNLSRTTPVTLGVLMIGVPKSQGASHGPRAGLPTGVMLRLGFLCFFVALLFYIYAFWQPETKLDPGSQIEAPRVNVPQVDTTLLQSAKDETHEQRLFLEPEPLRHLLEKSLDVASADATAALGMPTKVVPLADLLAARDDYRGRWLWYKGRVLQLNGPRQGHPVAGQSIYEAILELPGGGYAMTTFSTPPPPEVTVGSWARVEGFLLKLRDLTVPVKHEQVPMLVGRQLQRAYEDWGEVTSLDREVLGRIADTTGAGSDLETADEAWRRIDDDQTEPLWHLGAYALAHREIPLSEWRKIPALTEAETWGEFKRNEVARGTPMRILGMLVMSRTIAAAANPAGIERWTEAWVQVKDLGGKTIPVWVPAEREVQLGSTVEIRGYYFRRFAYESRSNQQYWTPLFVAAAIDPFDIDVGPAMREIGMVALTGTSVLIALTFWGVRRERRRAKSVQESLVARRRKRRQQRSAAATPAEMG
jgi:hypothetical protein